MPYKYPYFLSKITKMATSSRFIPTITTNTPGIAIAGYNITSSGISRGPLDALDDNKFNKVALKYPRNLMSDPSRKHYVIFSLFRPLAKAATAPAEGIQPTKENLTVENATTLATQVFEALTTSAKEIGSAIQTLSSSKLNEDCYKTIALYTPDNMSNQQSMSYDEISTTSVLGTPYFLGQAGATFADKFNQMVNSGGITGEKLVNLVGNDPYAATAFGTLIDTVGSKVGLGPGATQLLLGRIGQAVNPQVQVLFRQTDLRTFQFDFTMTPYSPEEAATIKEIVKSFRMAAAPEIQTNSTFGTGIFFNVPHQFGITFMYDGEENTNVNRIARCVATNVSVDYAPMGWMTFDQGVPVQTKLSLQFKEIELIDRTRISRDDY
jgi:hypothetical protein